MALLVASVCADDHPNTNPNPSPDNSEYNNVDNAVSYPPRRRYGGGKPTPVAGSAWGGGSTGRIRAKAGRRRRRRRWGRPANWVRPNQPVNNDWAEPSESESWDVAPDYESWNEPSEPDWVSPPSDPPTISPTESPAGGVYQVCDKVRSYYLYSSLLNETTFLLTHVKSSPHF